MSAERHGERLLAEVHEEGLDQVGECRTWPTFSLRENLDFPPRQCADLDGFSTKQLLSEIRLKISPESRSILGVPALDGLLESIRFPPPPLTANHPGWTSPAPSFYEQIQDNAENDGVTTPARAAHNPRASEIRPRPPVIELTSLYSAAGKTNLLYLVTAISILPVSHGGKQSAAVWLNTDGRFSASRLVEVTKDVLSRSNSISIAVPGEADDDLPLIHEALRHVHVFHPTSSPKLLATLESLPDYLLGPGTQISGQRPLGLLVLDSATAFYWQDRLDADIARLENLDAAGQGSSPAKKSSSRAVDVIRLLRNLQADFDCAVLFTTASTTTPNLVAAPSAARTSGPISSRQHQHQHHPPPSQQEQLPNPPSQSIPLNPWTTFATLTLSLWRIQPPQFAPTMSLAECLRDRERREDACRKGRFVAMPLIRDGIRTGGGGGGGRDGDGDATRVKSEREARAVVFRVTEEGVWVPGDEDRV